MKALAIAALAAAGAAVSTPASAALFVFEAFMDGPSEVPVNASPGTGYARVMFDDVLDQMAVYAEFSGLLSPVTVAHIHGPTAVADTGTAGVMTTTPTFTGFPVGVTFGTYSRTFDMTLASSYRAGFLTGFGGSTSAAADAVLAALVADKAYFNIHTEMFGGGEIRGFLHAVPEPSTWAMMILGFGMAGGMARRGRGARRRAALIALV